MFFLDFDLFPKAWPPLAHHRRERHVLPSRLISDLPARFFVEGSPELPEQLPVEGRHGTL